MLWPEARHEGFITSAHNSLARASYMAPPPNRIVDQEIQSCHDDQMAKNRNSWQTAVNDRAALWSTKDLDQCPSHRQSILISSPVNPACKKPARQHQAWNIRISRGYTYFPGSGLDVLPLDLEICEWKYYLPPAPHPVYFGKTEAWSPQWRSPLADGNSSSWRIATPVSHQAGFIGVPFPWSEECSYVGTKCRLLERLPVHWFVWLLALIPRRCFLSFHHLLSLLWSRYWGPEPFTACSIPVEARRPEVLLNQSGLLSFACLLAARHCRLVTWFRLAQCARWPVLSALYRCLSVSWMLIPEAC